VADPTRTLQRECLNGHVFAAIEEAQAAVDAFAAEYNFDRPHQGIEDPYPADRFTARHQTAATGLELRIPAGLIPEPTRSAVPAPRESVDPDAMIVSTGLAEAMEADRVVPASGNLMVAQQQIWLGPARAGLLVVIWVDTERLHVLGVDGGRIKTTASQLSQRDLARLRADGGRSARPSPLPPVQPEVPRAVEVDRLVIVHGGVTVGGKQIHVGSHLAGQRVRIRPDGILLHVIDEAGQLRRTLRSPLSPAACARLRHGRPAGPPPPPDPDGMSVDRVVGIQGTHPGRRADGPRRPSARPQGRQRAPRGDHPDRVRRPGRHRRRTQTEHHRRQPVPGRTPDPARLRATGLDERFLTPMCSESLDHDL
jgi:hypothetical protein